MDEKRSSIAQRHYEHKCLFFKTKHDRLEATFRQGLARMRLTEIGAAERLRGFASACHARKEESVTGSAGNTFVERRARAVGERVGGGCAAALGWLQGKMCPRTALGMTIGAGRGMELMREEESGGWEAPPAWLDEVEVRWRCFSDPEWDRRGSSSESGDEDGSGYGDDWWRAPVRWVCYTPDTEVGSCDGGSIHEQVDKDGDAANELIDDGMVIEKAIARGLFVQRAIAEPSKLGSSSISRPNNKMAQ
ncbi:hypothetical protein B0T25DRAFT_549451 [Lasiosphaeria hispida]|uniref:Uncharacterized protein n=1 Tax=Lasiosphaeria hispida TaxID=260671 RepID=A0AAJ0MD76_9PEZI|nr:hypothetical protein B0T25DRAFT_549451 [Lasiosphaeria hispida]